MASPRPGRPAVLAVAVMILAACSGSGHGNAAAFCARLKVDAPALMSNPTNPNAKKTVVDAFHRLKALAPEAIAADWERLSDLVDVLAAYDPSTSDPFGSDYAAALDPKVQTAASHVRTWAQTNCGVNLALTPATSAP